MPGNPLAVPRDLLAQCRELRERALGATAGLWPRANALLARQALEGIVRSVWKQRDPAMEGCSWRAQLLCLGDALGDRELAQRTHHAWWALSRACHHHAYELSPTSGELAGWSETVEELLRKAEKVMRRGQDSST